MSGKLMGEVFACELDVAGVEPATARLVLLALADHANVRDADHRIHPSIALIAWKTGVHERTVQRAIAGLIALRVLHVLRRPAPHRATEYRIALGALRRKPGRKDGVAPSLTHGGAPSVTHDKAARTDDKPRSTEDTVAPPKPEPEPEPEPGAGDRSRDRGRELRQLAERTARAMSLRPERPRRTSTDQLARMKPSDAAAVGAYEDRRDAAWLVEHGG